FLEQNRLAMRGEPNPFFAQCGGRLMRAVGVPRIGRIHVSEYQFRRGSGEIIFKLRGDERSPAGLGVQFVKLCLRSGTKDFAHSNRPNASRDARERNVFNVEAAIEKEREPRPELIDRNSASSEHLRVSEPVRERVRGLLHRRRTGFAHVITANPDRIPARHFAGGELHHVGQKTQRRFDWKSRFVLRLDFLKNIGLDRAAKFWNNVRPETAFRRRDVHRHDDWRRTDDRHRRREIRRAEIEPVVETHHVFDRVDRDTALANFSKNAVLIAVDAVKCRTIECGAEPMRSLVAGQVMETLVRVLRQHQTGEQTGWLFRLRHSLVDLLRLRFAVLFKTFHLANRLEIHLAIGAVQKWKFARQPFTKQKARDLTRFIDFGKRESRQRQSSRRPRGRNLCLDVVPTAEQIASEFLIGARALHLIENELVILLNRFNDLSELTHDFFRSFPRLDLSLAEINPNSLSTPGSRCRFATVSTRRWARRFCSRRCSISVCAVRARCKSLLFTTTISARSSITIFCNCNRLP